MKPSEELREQREAILRGTWVQGHPLHRGEACLAMRRGGCLTPEAQRALGLALGELGWNIQWYFGQNPFVSSVNDHQFTSASDAIEALELAERIAKEAGL